MKTPYLFLFLISIYCLFFFITNHFLLTKDLYFDQLGGQMGIERVEKLIRIKEQWTWINYVIIPVLYSLKFLAVTLWILCGTILFGYKNTFKEIYRVVLLAELVWIIPSLFTLLWFGFLRTNYSLADIQFFQPLSLLNLFDVNTVESWLIYPLKSFNLFEVGYILALTMGIKRLIKRDYTSALNFTVPIYGSAVISWIVFITFLSINLST